MWIQLLAFLGLIGISWLLFSIVKNNPQLFTKEILNKSFYTMGILGLMLISFLGLVIMLLKY